MEIKITIEDGIYILLERLCRAYGTHAADLLTTFCEDAVAGGDEWGHEPEDAAVMYLDMVTHDKPCDFYSWAVRSGNAGIMADFFDYIDQMAEVDPDDRTQGEEHYLAFIKKQLDGMWEEYCDAVLLHDLDREKAMRDAREQCKIFG